MIDEECSICGYEPEEGEELVDGKYCEDCWADIEDLTDSDPDDWDT